MNCRFAITAALALALALGGCATYDASHGDGSYRGNYDGGYYAAPQNGYGDYYYDRPEIAVSDYEGGYFGGPFLGYGFGLGAFGPCDFGFGPGFGCDPWFYDPWFYRPWYGHGWHRPWPGHHGHAFEPNGDNHAAHHFDSHGGSHVRPHN